MLYISKQSFSIKRFLDKILLHSNTSLETYIDHEQNEIQKGQVSLALSPISWVLQSSGTNYVAEG